MSGVGLATYRRCTFSEKRAVLRVFWSRRESDSDTVNEAAREYGPYALVMVVVIAIELAVIAAVLFNRGNVWAWPAVAATVFAVVSVVDAGLSTRDRLTVAVTGFVVTPLDFGEPSVGVREG